MSRVAWPFVGRESELETAGAALGRRGVLVVTGEAGVGKSRFVRELAERHLGEVVAVTGSASARDIPLGAFAPALVAHADGDVFPGPARALAVLRGRWVRVDDAHLLDDVSATLVGQLGAEPTARLLLVIRSGESAPAAIAALVRADDVDRIELVALDRARCGRLLRAVLAGPVHARDEHRLYDVTRGNPLWLRHLVDGEREAGRLASVDGAWRWDGPRVLPPALRDLVAERIGALTPVQQRVLELVSLGEPLGLGLLASLAGPGPVDELARKELIVVVSEGARSTVRLGHPLYGEATRALLSVPRARRLRGELSAALAATGARRGDDELRRAVLGIDGDRPPGLAVLARAAVRAAGLGDLPLAERLWREAARAGGGAEAHLGLGSVLAQMHRTDEAIGALATAATAVDGDAERVRLAVTRANVLYFAAGRAPEAWAVLDEVETPAKAFGPTVLGGIRAALAVSEGDLRGTADHAGPVLADAEPADHSLTGAVWAAGHARALCGSGPPLRPLVERGLAAAGRNADTAALQPNLGFAEILDADLRGEPDGAGARMRWLTTSTGEGPTVWSAIYEGRVARCAGAPASAAALLTSAVAHFPGYGMGWTLWLHSTIAQCHGALGDAEEARRAVERAVAARHPTVTMVDWELDLARGWASAAAGARREAIEHVVRGADDARRRGMLAPEVLLRQTAVRFGDRSQAGRLRRLATVIGSVRSRLAARHARALRRGDASELSAVSTALEEAGTLVEAVDAAAQAATLARLAGALADAGTAERRACALAARCEGVRTPALREATVPTPLSGREREVATLAADGLSNREIAERLQLSVRTVESHVYRAYQRLGLPDRAALVAAVAPSPPPDRPEMP